MVVHVAQNQPEYSEWNQQIEVHHSVVRGLWDPWWRLSVALHQHSLTRRSGKLTLPTEPVDKINTQSSRYEEVLRIIQITFSCFSLKTYLVIPHLGNMVLTRGHNIPFLLRNKDNYFYIIPVTSSYMEH